MKLLLGNLLWSSPLWGWAAVIAAGIPILAHLLSRRRYRLVEFPAARFVLQAREETTRIDRPRHWLLLLLRALALLAVVLAFMRPVWRPEDVQAVSNRQRQTLVILIDGSASMQRVADGRSAFEQARDQATSLIDRLDPGRDRAAIYIISDTARPLLPEPTANFTLLRSLLTQTQCTWRHDDPQAAAAAIQQVSAISDRPLTCVYLSDEQRLRDRDLRETLVNAGHPIRAIRVGQPQDNTSIHLVQVRPYPVVAGEPVSILLRIQHFGEAAREITLQAAFDDTTTSRLFQLSPRSERLVTIDLPQASANPGWLTIQADPSDAFIADDRTGIFIHPSDSRPVCLVTDDANAPVVERVRTMLMPDNRTEPSVEFRVIHPDELSRQSWGAGLPPTYVLTQLHEVMDANQCAFLWQSIQMGAGVVWVADTPALRQTMNEAAGPLRFRQSPPTDRRARQSVLHLDAPELHIFEGPARALLTQVPWVGVMPAHTLDHSTPIITDEQGTAIIASQSIGRGNLYVINSLITPEQSGITTDPAFVVLFNELVRLATPGQPMPTPLTPGASLPTDWEGQVIRHRWDNNETSVAAVDAPGELELLAGERVTDGRWIGVEAGESDLLAADDGVFTDHPTGGRAGGAVRDDIAEGGIVHLWPYAMLLALSMAAIEAGVLIRFHRRGAA